MVMVLAMVRVESNLFDFIFQMSIYNVINVSERKERINKNKQKFG